MPSALALISSSHSKCSGVNTAIWRINATLCCLIRLESFRLTSSRILMKVLTLSLRFPVMHSSGVSHSLFSLPSLIWKLGIHSMFGSKFYGIPTDFVPHRVSIYSCILELFPAVVYYGCCCWTCWSRRWCCGTLINDLIICRYLSTGFAGFSHHHVRLKIHRLIWLGRCIRQLFWRLLCWLLVW